jgi:hypothetical protein
MLKIAKLQDQLHLSGMQFLGLLLLLLLMHDGPGQQSQCSCQDEGGLSFVCNAPQEQCSTLGCNTGWHAWPA